MKWNLRWAAAHRDIWRPSDLLEVFAQVDFHPSLSKVAALWSAKPITVRLDDLDKICQALNCTVGDLLEAEPVEAAGTDTVATQADAAGSGAGDTAPALQPARPTPRQHGRRRRPLPPN